MDSKFNIGDEIWYVNGNAITHGIVATVIQNMKTKQVSYKLRKKDSERYNGDVAEDRVFESIESAKASIAHRSIRRIERESELLSEIEKYVNLGENVKTPLFIKLCDGWGRFEIQEYLQKKYNTLGVNGHPFKRGHKHFVNEKGEIELISNHPELTSDFYPPSGYDPSEPPSFFIRSLQADDLCNPAYYLECVQNLKIPFVYLAPKAWWNSEDNSYQMDSPQVISDFETILYAPTVKGWLKDMWDKESGLPNQIRMIDSTEDERVLSVFWTELRDNLTKRWETYEKLSDASKKIRPLFLEQRVKFILEYADSIKNLDSYDDLSEINSFTGAKSEFAFASIPYLFEGLTSFYYNMFIGRALCPDIKISNDDIDLFLVRQHFNNLCDSFAKYLQNTEEHWVFDFSKPVPETVLKKVQDVLSEN